MEDHMARQPAKSSLPRVSALHIMTLFTIAVAHPLYTVLGHADHAPFFIAHQSRAIDIWLLVASWSLLAPFAIVLLVWLTSRLCWLAGWAVHLVFVTLSFVAVFWQVSERMVPGRS